jgi:hypothetical protein
MSASPPTALSTSLTFLCAVARVRRVGTLHEAAAAVSGNPSGTIIVPRIIRPAPWFATFTLPSNLDIRNIPISVSTNLATDADAQPSGAANDSIDTLCTHIPMNIAASLPAYIVSALTALAYTHASATTATKVFGRVAIVAGTPCTRLHHDKVRLRTLCTLFGPGCVVAPRHAVDTATLFGSARVRDAQLTPEEHDSLVLKRPAELVHLEPGDVAFLAGARADMSRTTTASIHRSPRVPSSCRRLVIQIDDIP